MIAIVPAAPHVLFALHPGFTPLDAGFAMFGPRLAPFEAVFARARRPARFAVLDARFPVLPMPFAMDRPRLAMRRRCGLVGRRFHRRSGVGRRGREGAMAAVGRTAMARF